MNIKQKALVAATTLSLLAPLTLGVAGAQVTTTTINTAVSGAVSDASSVANTTILIVLAFVGLLIAAGWAWRFFKRHVGKRI